MTTSFYWHDYETWGAEPRKDRPAQFAGIRTDLDFNQIGQELLLYAKPADDFLPQPEACLITGITPQQAMAEGVPEADFFRAILHEMARPGTCTLGYNSIRFDDEITRFGLWRNLFDPYAREWQNQCSRWDIIDLVRLTRALRPDGINWPLRDDGSSSFRLEHLTAANGIAQEGAHDALVDVRATIEIAKLIKTRQPKLFDFVFNNRDKKKLADQLDLARSTPVLHVSARYPASKGCIASVLPIARHPRNQNSYIVFDLRSDPSVLMDLSVEELSRRLYTPTDQLAEGMERVPLKEIKTNHTPIVVPMSTITPKAREEWAMPEASEQMHLAKLRQMQGLQEKMDELFSGSEFPPAADPDQALYDGFVSPSDRRQCERILASTPEQLANLQPRFQDRKLDEIYFRFRARNWPETLSLPEQKRWEEFRKKRLTDPASGASIVLQEYRKQLSRLTVDTGLSVRQRQVVDQLLDWPSQIGV